MSNQVGAWHPDPYGRHQQRYFDGIVWTAHVADNGVAGLDEVAAEPSGEAVERWWTSERNAGTYLASHPSRPERLDDLGLGFLSLGFLAINGNNETVVALRWDEIASVTIETLDSIQSRVTATRVLLMGALGFFIKKSTTTAYLTIRDTTDEWVFGVENCSAAGLWAALQPVKARRPDKFRMAGASESPAPPAGPRPTPRERLVTIDQLLQEGLISPQEHATRRAAIIAEL